VPQAELQWNWSTDGRHLHGPASFLLLGLWPALGCREGSQEAQELNSTAPAGCRHKPREIMNDQAIEKEIQAKGLTAPRVTPSDIEANIASEHYFTASDGVFAVTRDIKHPELSLLTFCVLILRNGFTVTGESACASPENFDAELGRKIARENAINKVWPLMGYALKEQLHISAQLRLTGSLDNFNMPLPDGSCFVVTKTYADGTSATGVAPLPDHSPAEQDRLQAHADMVRESGWAPGDGSGQQSAG
jgi:hypothetical protein